MKQLFIIVASVAALPVAFASATAQDMAALAPTTASAPDRVGDDLLTVSVMPAPKKPAQIRAAQNLRAGSVLHASDLIVDGDGANPLDMFVGMELKRAVYAGKLVTPNDVGPATAIQRNAIVTLEFARGPLLITTEGRALDAGAVGDSVRIMNLNSKIILSAVVTGPNKAVTQ